MQEGTQERRGVQGPCPGFQGSTGRPLRPGPREPPPPPRRTGGSRPGQHLPCRPEVACSAGPPETSCVETLVRVRVPGADSSPSSGAHQPPGHRPAQASRWQQEEAAEGCPLRTEPRPFPLRHQGGGGTTLSPRENGDPLLVNAILTPKRFRAPVVPCVTGPLPACGRGGTDARGHLGLPAPVLGAPANRVAVNGILGWGPEPLQTSPPFSALTESLLKPGERQAGVGSVGPHCGPRQVPVQKPQWTGAWSTVPPPPPPTACPGALPAHWPAPPWVPTALRPPRQLSWGARSLAGRY